MDCNHGFDVDLSNMPSGNDPARITGRGIESPKTSMWRTIFVSLVRAVDLMTANHASMQSDPGDGGSQGGACRGGGCTRPADCVLYPSHSGLGGSTGPSSIRPAIGLRHECQAKGQSEEQFLRTLSYFDVANHTGYIRCPVAAEIV